MANIVKVPGAEGVYEVEGLGYKFQINQWRVGDVKDSVQIALTPTAGQKYYFFRDLTNKNLQHNNMDNNAGRMSAHTDLIINRISAYPVQAFADSLPTDADVIKLIHAAVFEMFVNGERKITDQPLYQLPSGYGATGSTTRNNTGVVTNGVASSAAAPQLMVAQRLGPNDSFRGELTFYDNAWLNGGSLMPTFSVRMVVTALLEGLIKKVAGA